MLRLILAAGFAFAPLMAAAQTIYKVQMPDGSVMYTDSVPSGGKVLEEREAKTTPRVSTVPNQAAGKSVVPGAVVRPSTGPAITGVPSPGARPPGKNVMPPDVNTSERELAVARRKLELGREPLPGERRGLAGGGSRLTPEYEARIAALEREVAAAEAKLKSAYDSRRN